jgi:hypothetical protein
MMNIYFYNDRQSGGYAEPAAYTLEYWDGSEWQHASNQTRYPDTIQANYNNNKFTPVTTEKVRVAFANIPGKYTAVTEIQLYAEGGERPLVENAAPVVEIFEDESKRSNLKVTLVGSVTDDGMPYGEELATEWSVISKPDPEAMVFFSGASEMEKSVSVSVPGDMLYGLRQMTVSCLLIPILQLISLSNLRLQKQISLCRQSPAPTTLPAGKIST